MGAALAWMEREAGLYCTCNTLACIPAPFRAALVAPRPEAASNRASAVAATTWLESISAASVL